MMEQDGVPSRWNFRWKSNRIECWNYKVGPIEDSKLGIMVHLDSEMVVKLDWRMNQHSG